MSDPYIDNLTGREKMTTLPRREYDLLKTQLDSYREALTSIERSKNAQPEMDITEARYIARQALEKEDRDGS